MPKKNFKSITVKTKSYKKLQKDYNEKKLDLAFNGICSFSAYIESLSNTSHSTPIDDLKEVLCINTQVLMIMSDLMLGTNKEICEENQLRAKQHMFEYLKIFQEKKN